MYFKASSVISLLTGRHMQDAIKNRLRVALLSPNLIAYVTGLSSQVIVSLLPTRIFLQSIHLGSRQILVKTKPEIFNVFSDMLQEPDGDMKQKVDVLL